MRTTIEIKAEHRARLLELAASRGEKGFSSVVAEALEFFLNSRREHAKAVESALALRGAISPAEADELATRARATRAHWR